jgi:copper resistance protein B
MSALARLDGRWVLAAAAAAASAFWACGAAAQPAAPDLPPPTAEQRAAAFPDVGGVNPRKMMPENPFTTFVLVDELEQRDADGGDITSWDVTASAGRNFNKLWVRSEGERQSGRTDSAELSLLWGRSFAPWWDFVAGMREDFRPEPSRTWAAFGVQGLAPYRFEIEATAYLGEGGQTSARVKTEYELLMTNRLILQPLLELNWYADDAPRYDIGAGLADAELGLRLRYEIRREIAPYIGVTRERKLGRTADLARAAGEHTTETQFVVGIRLWF